MTLPDELSWTPVLRGTIYCSPACGGGCTKSAYDLAVGLADNLARRLGNGFVPRVTENLGWHYGCTLEAGDDYDGESRMVYVSANHHYGKGPSWTAFVGTGHCGMCLSDGSSATAHSDTGPMEAVREVIANVRRERDRMQGFLDDFGHLENV